ncbi:MAG TPA: hypothetical protein VNS58_32405 [Puia sp.]|nr:hypothetical protein [Puia sp.]
MKLSSSIHAVLTGDIVNSTRLEPAMEKGLIKALKEILVPYKYEFYRGDSFQVYLKKPVSSLRLALLCRTQAISMTEGQDETSLSDIRISIGIGPVALPVKDLGMAKGEAFVLSGRFFDKLQSKGAGTEKRLSISSGQTIADIGLRVIAEYIDAIYKRMTGKQAAVILGLLKGKAQQQIASELNRSKSTVSQSASSGEWPAIEMLLEQYELLINHLV